MATQLLWINLVTDGAPALALGVDPADEGVMARPPRPPDERVITRGMWSGILCVGGIMAVGTLLVIDASLPGGLIEGSGHAALRADRAFTTLVFYSLFTVFCDPMRRAQRIRGRVLQPLVVGRRCVVASVDRRPSSTFLSCSRRSRTVSSHCGRLAAVCGCGQLVFCGCVN